MQCLLFKSVVVLPYFKNKALIAKVPPRIFLMTFEVDLKRFIFITKMSPRFFLSRLRQDPTLKVDFKAIFALVLYRPIYSPIAL